MNLEQRVAQWYAQKDQMMRRCLWALAVSQVAWMTVLWRMQSSRSEPIWMGYSDSNGSMWLGPGQKLIDSKSLHLEEALWATKALLDRGPTSMDLPELIEALFVGDALQTIERLRASERKEFDEKKIHQKAEVMQVEAVETRPNLVLVKVAGQLVRSGVFRNEPILEAVPFQLKLSLRPNPDLLKNRRRPLNVVGFQLSYEN